MMSSSKLVIAVTGANSQTAFELRRLIQDNTSMEFHFYDSTIWNITDPKSNLRQFELLKPDVLINTAAYTAVDKAELDQESCYAVNTIAVEDLAKLCKRYNCILFHFSSDYVFHQNQDTPISEDQLKKPIGIYAKSKSAGEDVICQILEKYILIRTSWVYSAHGHNFVKTMLRLAKDKNELQIVDDQIGSPTYAKDLARLVYKLVQLITKNIAIPWGVYHFSNSGQTSWNKFAEEIFAYQQINMNVIPISTSAYKAAAPRPAFSVLDCNKLNTTFGITCRPWKEALHECLDEINNTQ